MRRKIFFLYNCGFTIWPWRSKRNLRSTSNKYFAQNLQASTFLKFRKKEIIVSSVDSARNSTIFYHTSGSSRDKRTKALSNVLEKSDILERRRRIAVQFPGSPFPEAEKNSFSFHCEIEPQQLCFDSEIQAKFIFTRWHIIDRQGGRQKTLCKRNKIKVATCQKIRRPAIIFCIRFATNKHPIS